MSSPAFTPTLSAFFGQAAAPRGAVCRTPASARVSPRMVSAPVKKPATKTKPKPTVERQTKMPPMYRLYIYNDPVNTRERVVDVLIKTCQGLTFSRAYSAMQEAHENGRGMVLVVCQEIAEHYCATINGGKLSFIGAALGYGERTDD